MANRVLILEDDTLTRLSLVTAVRHFGYDVVIEEPKAADALSRALITKPDLAILDLHLGPGPTGIDVAVSLRKQNPRIGIVFLTSYDDPRLLNPNLPSVPTGAHYLTKSSIEKISTLKEVLEDAILGHLPNEAARSSTFINMTDTQIETLRLVALGHTNSEIARMRFVKEKSVEVTISRLAKQLGLAMSPTINQRVSLAKAYFRSIGSNLENDNVQT